MSAERLEKLLEKEKQLKERIKQERARATLKIRKENKRRYALVGESILAAIESGEFIKEDLAKILEPRLTAQSDRDLFDFLAPIEVVGNDTLNGHADLPRTIT